jgi:RHS repeat-associated protein
MDDLLTHSHRRFICFIAHFVLCIAALAHTAFAHAATVITYFHNDAANTPVVATNANGTVVWRETHLPYGERFSKQANVNAHPLQFTGKSEDPDTGFIDEGARQYDPVTAQFTGFDPAPVDINDPRSFTRYGYANNNPYRYNDPNGESPVDIAFLAADTLKLGLAIYSGNAVAIRTAAVDFAISAVGVVDPVPFTGEALKAAVFAKRAEAAAKANGMLRRQIDALRRVRSKMFLVSISMNTHRRCLKREEAAQVCAQ